MLFKSLIVCAVVQLALAQSPITYKDGKIGVNFGGYHAEAGLGGLLTGDASHGGLSASAGTPFGQSAHAGLGGNTGPNTRGGLFAGATAGSGVGASASLAGDLQNGGSFGVGQAEAHAGGVQKEVIKTVSSGAYPGPVAPSGLDEDDNDLTHNVAPQQVPQVQPVQQVPTVQQTITHVVQPATFNVQKVKVRRPVPTYTQYVVQKQVQLPRFITKTYSYRPYQPAVVSPPVQYPLPEYQPVVYQKRVQVAAPYQVVQRVEVQTEAGPTTTTTSTTPRPPYVYTYDKSKVLNEIFSIPINVLNSVNQILNAKLAGGYAVHKTITYN